MSPASALLLAAYLAHPARVAPPADALEVGHAALEAEARWQLPAGILLAVILAEAGGRARLVTRERHGCSVGPAQVYVPGCHRARVQRLLVLAVNLDRAGALLAGSRRLCGQHARWRACRTHWVGGYNGGSPGYAARVVAIWRRIAP